MIGELVERIVRGPEPPVGIVHTPRPSLRCRIGLHLWAEIWGGVILEQQTDGLGRYSSTLGFNLDRPADFTQCLRCSKVRHREPEPGL